MGKIREELFMLNPFYMMSIHFLLPLAIYFTVAFWVYRKTGEPLLVFPSIFLCASALSFLRLFFL